jgi:hypothetical protein
MGGGSQEVELLYMCTCTYMRMLIRPTVRVSNACAVDGEPVVIYAGHQTVLVRDRDRPRDPRWFA